MRTKPSAAFGVRRQSAGADGAFGGVRAWGARGKREQAPRTPDAGATNHALNRISRSGRGGFTLIELILVMSILTIAISITAPALANFFRGRSLDSEARRLLAMVKQGQSRAVSEGIPIEFWIDSSQGTFGLEAEASYEETDSRAIQFTLDPDMQIQLAGSLPTTTTPGSSIADYMQFQLVTLSANAHANLPKIRFLPDGTVSSSTLDTIRLTSRDGASYWITPTRNRLSYEIRNRYN